MKNTTLLLLAMLLSVAGFAQKKPKLKTWEDSLAYAIGVDLSISLTKTKVSNLNTDMMAAGYDQQQKGKALFTEEDMKMIMTKFQQKMQAQAEAEANQAAEGNKKKGEAFFKENASKPGVVSLPSGLQYKVIKEGTGTKPTLSNQVVAHYEGKTIDGTIFDSSYERGEPATFPLGGVIRGWQEGLQLMSPGAIYELYIPSEMGYGAQGFPPDIGPNETLIFKVELVAVK